MSDTVNIRELNALVASKADFINMVTHGMDKTIVGQKHLVESLDSASEQRPRAA